MTHDPFDDLRDANPIPDASLPAAPMDTAERIMRRGAAAPGRLPGWTIATAAALAVLIAGGGWMVWLGRGNGEITAADPTTSIAPSTTAPATVMPVMETTIYLFTGDGVTVTPVSRTVPVGDPVEAALAALLAGPTDEERRSFLSSSLSTDLYVGLPAIQVIDVQGSTAIVRIPSAILERGGPSPGELALIIFTLTRVDGIDGVEFVLGDGQGVPGGIVADTLELVPRDRFGEYSLVYEVATRLAFEVAMPPAFVEAPLRGTEISLPYAANGFAYSIGNEVRLTLTDYSGSTLWQKTVTATCGTPWSDCRGEWDWSTWAATIPDVGYYAGSATLTTEVFGSGVEILDEQSIPLIISSSGTATTTLGPAGPAEPGELAVYMLMEADATHTTPGPHLVPAAWTTAVLSAPLTDPPRQAMEWLLQGPLPGWVESTPALSSAIPEGTRLLSLDVVDGTAIVDLSSEFVRGGEVLPFEYRMAQAVFTLTRFDHINAVLFSIEGTPITSGGTPPAAEQPSARGDFEDLLPPIMIETPMYWGYETGNPLIVSGTANVFEATVSLALTDNEGLILWEGFTTATCGTGCRGDWSIEIPYSVPTDQLGAVFVWEESARDGSQTNVREHPVWLTAASD